jgi:hypothetical protein
MLDSFNMVRGAAPQTLVLSDRDHGHGEEARMKRPWRPPRTPAS